MILEVESFKLVISSFSINRNSDKSGKFRLYLLKHYFEIMALVGGTGQVQDATADIQDLCDKVRSDVETKAGNSFSVYVAKSFTSQLVNGTNYFVKIHVGGDSYVHVRIYRSFQGDSNLHSCQLNKTAEEPVRHFDASE